MEKTILLDPAVSIGDKEFDSITLMEPTAGQLEKAMDAKTDIGIAITLIGLVSKVPRKVVEQLTQTQLKECSDFLGSFGASKELET